MITKAEAEKIAEVLSHGIDYQDGMVDSREVWDVACEMALLIEEVSQGVISEDVFLQWCKNGPTAAEIFARQDRGAA